MTPPPATRAPPLRGFRAGEERDLISTWVDFAQARRRFMSKTIGILTSGGDCAGLNATIRAVALRAHHGYGWKTIGISHGTHGLLHRPVAAEPLDPARLDAVLARQGGTFLGTINSGNPFAFPMH